MKQRKVSYQYQQNEKYFQNTESRNQEITRDKTIRRYEKNTNFVETMAGLDHKS